MRGPLLLVVGLAGAGSAITAATNGPPCDEQIAQSNSQPLGLPVPGDPEALRQRDTAYEKAFAAIFGLPAVPTPVQLGPNDYGPPYVPKEGVFEPAEQVLPQWTLVNCWEDHVRNQWVRATPGVRSRIPSR
jgi:hypothetical protein